MPQLHLPQPDAHVLPQVFRQSPARSSPGDAVPIHLTVTSVYQGVSLHQACWEELRRGEERGPVLPHHLLPAW